MDEDWIIVGSECPSMHISNGCPQSGAHALPAVRPSTHLHCPQVPSTVWAQRSSARPQCPHPRNKGIVTDTLRLSTLMEGTGASPTGTCGCQGRSRPTLTDLGLPTYRVLCRPYLDSNGDGLVGPKMFLSSDLDGGRAHGGAGHEEAFLVNMHKRNFFRPIQNMVA